MRDAAHGVWLQAVDGASISNTRAHDNAGYGLCADFNDPGFAKAVRLAAIVQNRCWGNLRGISIGNFNSDNRLPATWGNANPDAIGVLVQDNICHDNAIYALPSRAARWLFNQTCLATMAHSAMAAPAFSPTAPTHELLPTRWSAPGNTAWTRAAASLSRSRPTTSPAQWSASTRVAVLACALQGTT